MILLMKISLCWRICHYGWCSTLSSEFNRCYRHIFWTTVLLLLLIVFHEFNKFDEMTTRDRVFVTHFLAEWFTVSLNKKKEKKIWSLIEMDLCIRLRYLRFLNEQLPLAKSKECNSKAKILLDGSIERMLNYIYPILHSMTNDYPKYSCTCIQYH